MDKLESLFERSNLLFKKPAREFNEEEYLQLEADYAAFMKTHPDIPDIGARIWRESCFESVFMICDGIRFEKAKLNILETVRSGNKPSEAIDLHGQNLGRMLIKLKEDALLTKDGQITSEGELYLTEHKGKSVLG